jgi:geranylgeranyl diphosphate synthase type I
MSGTQIESSTERLEDLVAPRRVDLDSSSVPVRLPTIVQSRLVEAVDRTLVEFLSAQITMFAEADPELGHFARTTRDCVLAGGKRLRPTFAYWGWRGLLAHPAPPAPVVPAFAALELLHTFAIVQDDIMDASSIRRGRPTAHRVLATRHGLAGRKGDASRFGASAAMLLGDLCLVWADQLLATATVPGTALLAARRCYDRMRVEAIVGQYLDLVGESTPDKWSVRRAMWVARNKTASYTVLRPLLFGAALTDQPVSPRITASYTAYGVAVGEAFQLRDDLLGVYGDPDVTGKPAGDDLRSGKPTALLLTARRLATAAQRVELDRALVTTASGGDLDVDRVAEVIAATGAVGRIEDMIDRRTDAARTAITKAPIDRVAREALAQLALEVTGKHRGAGETVEGAG